MPISLEKALELQRNPSNLRNICILAHVDHGKTSISDYLIATNGIISPKTCGAIRYLDARPDEQERGITMEASAISLYFSLVNSESASSEYLINLIDCPGHVDFAAEVSVASQLCDGALIIVDVVEGVCSQTHTVLHQAWNEHLQPILVLNKMDRLVAELKLTPIEAYFHLDKLIQNVNVITGEFFQKACAEGLDHPEIFFSPLRGNVVFTSALQGWGCQVDYFAHVFAAKLKLTVSQLLPWMWGEHYFDPKSKKILALNQLHGRDLKPLAVHLIFDNLWSIYEACGIGVMVLEEKPHTSKIQSIAQRLQLKLHPRDLNKSSEHVISTLLSQWLPLSKSLLVPIVKQIPSPKEAQQYRLPRVFPHLVTFPLAQDLFKCNDESHANLLGYFAKMIVLPRYLMPSLLLETSEPEINDLEEAVENMTPFNPILSENARILGLDTSVVSSEKEILVGIARLFSGRLRQGYYLYILGPKFNSDQPQSYMEISIDTLFLWVGNDVIQIPEVVAGQVFGFYSRSLNQCIFKCGTLSSTLDAPLLTQYTSWVPIVKVAVEPSRITDMNKVLRGLKLLNQSDPAVEVTVTPSGEHVLATAGEIHLERCLYDLRERFAKCDIQVSEPIVPFRETVVIDPLTTSKPTVDNNEGLPRGQTIVVANSQSFLVKCMPLPELVTEFLLNEREVSKSMDLLLDSSWLVKLQAVLDKCNDPIFSSSWATYVRQRGPSAAPANLLWSMNALHPDAVAAFHISVVQGPLCHEPMQGILWTIESDNTQAAMLLSATSDINEERCEVGIEDEVPGPLPPMQGSLPVAGTWVSIFRNALISTFSALPMRLVLAMYSMHVRCLYPVLGAVYQLISKRRGKVTSEQAEDGSPYFLVGFEIPILHSFQFVKELGSATSGAAFVQVLGTRWALVPEDPLDESNEQVEEVSAKKYYLALRRRKGLPVDTKLVEHGEKQRTLMRK